MKRPRTLPAFSHLEIDIVHKLLASQVAAMMGRKFEEGDWAYIYCTAKNLPLVGWSNLNIDVMHNGLGVEHKMLRQSSEGSLREKCGMRLMHPAATRSIRLPNSADPNEVMINVLSQYRDLIEQRRVQVHQSNPNLEPDMRTGWLLWQANLKEFLYFEEEMLPPEPSDYFAEWKESGGGSRKQSRNLWVYEKETGEKRYSITTAAGAKIQPYFDVPPPNDPNLYSFRVQGEDIGNGLIRIWVRKATQLDLQRILGQLSAGNLSEAISRVAIDTSDTTTEVTIPFEEAIPLTLTVEAYQLLYASFPGVSDEHMMQLLIQQLSR